MRIWMAAITATVALWVGGCNSPEWPTQRRNVMNTWAVEQYNQDSEHAAIIRQHTLYPYHFVEYGADLNELGERDLGVLAAHYRDNPGTLNVRQLGTSNDIYEARLATVTTMLTDMGVDTDRIRLGGGMAGGEGVSSARMIVILEEKRDEPLNLETVDLSTIEGSEE
jgi:hypothetical protein